MKNKEPQTFFGIHLRCRITHAKQLNVMFLKCKITYNIVKVKIMFY